MDRRKFLNTSLSAGAFTLIAGAGIISTEYTDFPGFDDKVQAGRAKNSITAVVAGLVGQKLYGNSVIDLEIQKSFFPYARVTGETSPTSINTYVDLTLTSVHFQAKNNSYNKLEGEVHKSEINWEVKQISDDRYEISRWGPKFDGALDLTVKDGKISGTFIRGGPHFDWNVNGTYNDSGKVNLEIDGHLNLGITLDGKIISK